MQFLLTPAFYLSFINSMSKIVCSLKNSTILSCRGKSSACGVETARPILIDFVVSCVGVAAFTSLLFLTKSRRQLLALKMDAYPLSFFPRS
jgi:hypothetical protein